MIMIMIMITRLRMLTILIMITRPRHQGPPVRSGPDVDKVTLLPLHVRVGAPLAHNNNNNHYSLSHVYL